MLLPHVRQDIRANRRLHFALFQALKKATYKPDAFYKACAIHAFFFFFQSQMPAFYFLFYAGHLVSGGWKPVVVAIGLAKYVKAAASDSQARRRVHDIHARLT